MLLKKSLDLFIGENGLIRLKGRFENGLIRLKGRLENSDVDVASKFPILLSDDHFSQVVIRKCHENVMHGGMETTLHHFRGRQVVKRVLHRCTTCRRHQTKPLIPPPSPALPTYRVTADFCFQPTGTDFARPLLVKSIYGQSSGLHKAYICLFTCATSRAVHLELTPDMQGSTFVRALRRFIARKGYPSLLLSDNAKTFKSCVLKSFLLKNNIDKQFILPASPWWGGFYERLASSVKLPLKKVLGKARLT